MKFVPRWLSVRLDAHEKIVKIFYRWLAEKSFLRLPSQRMLKFSERT
jgi:hypothetical protein